MPVVCGGLLLLLLLLVLVYFSDTAAKKKDEAGVGEAANKADKDDQAKNEGLSEKKIPQKVTEEDNRKFRKGGRYAYNPEYHYYYKIKHW